MSYGKRSERDELIESLARDLCIHLELGRFESYDKCGPVFVVDPVAVAKAKSFLRARLPAQLAEARAQRPIDGKFGIRGTAIVNLVSGEEIPQDEPLFLLRARDHHAIATLSKYLDFARFDCNDLHLAGIQQVLERFKAFQREHPERMKQPGKTRHLKLEPKP